MRQSIHTIKKKITQGIKRLHKHPPYIKIPLGILFLLIGAINIVNPFINGIFIIIIGGSLIGTSIYKKYKKTHPNKLSPKQANKKIRINLKNHPQQSKRK